MDWMQFAVQYGGMNIAEWYFLYKAAQALEKVLFLTPVTWIKLWEDSVH